MRVQSCRYEAGGAARGDPVPSVSHVLREHPVAAAGDHAAVVEQATYIELDGVAVNSLVVTSIQ